MLSHLLGPGLSRLSDVEPFLREAAASRAVEWEIKVYERSGFWDPFGILGFTSTSVMFTETEYSRFYHLALQPLRNGTKVSTMYANLEQAAATAFPTGSVEHVAMRHLGVVAIVRYATGAELTTFDWRTLLCVTGGSIIAGDIARFHFGWKSGVVCGLGPLALLYGMRSQLFGVQRPSLIRHVLPDAPPADAVVANARTPLGVVSASLLSNPPARKEIVIRPSDDASEVEVEEEVSVANDLREPTGKPISYGAASSQQATPAVWPVINVLDTAAPPPMISPAAIIVEVPPLCPAGAHGGNTPDDATVMASAEPDGRTYVTPAGLVAVVGQEFDKEIPHDQQPIVGALVGPCSKPPNVYSKNLRNLRACINERITKKQKGNVLTAAEMRKIGLLINNCMSRSTTRGVFSEKRIRKWCEEHLHIEGMQSGKWSLERLRNALEQLYSKTFEPDMADEDLDDLCQFQFKAALKAEDMPEGKAPRMLIADGDSGTLMALIVIKCFEDLLFDWFEDKSIKHLSKKKAMERIFKVLNKPSKTNTARAVEGDGSAWDTTCGSKIRGAIENPVLRHIMEIVIEYGVVPEAWHQQHTKACELKTLKLFYQDAYDKVRIKIDAIRRSGHRGTSVLNWWINFVMWVCSIFTEPWRFLDPTFRTGVDVTGQKRWWNGVFEGDDSLCVLDPPMREGDDLAKKFLKWWSAGGFDMKIVFCDTRATVVGWHMQCVNGHLTKVACPELPRALSNSGVSVSPLVVQATRLGGTSDHRMVAAASAMARAGEFAGILPSVSNKYLRFSQAITGERIVDREMSIRVFGEDGHDSRESVEYINASNLKVTPHRELVTLKALGYGGTISEIDKFMNYGWSLDPEVLLNYDAFRESLPPGWRRE